MTSVASAPARVTRRICEAIKDQISSGLLGPGARLPSTRSLAAEWGVSRTTVTAAYEQLIAEGYLETRQGAPARVARGLAPPAGPRGQPAPSIVPDRLSGYGQRLADLAGHRPGPTGTVRDGFPLRRPGSRRFSPCSPGGRRSPPPCCAVGRASRMAILAARPTFRTALQGYLWRARGLRCEPDQIVVVNGSQQGIDLREAAAWIRGTGS